MSKLTKRLTALLLSGMLVIGSAPVGGFAAELGQTSETAVEEAAAEEAVATDEVAEEQVLTGATDAPAEEYYTVTLDANGGYFANEWDDAAGDYVKNTEVLNKNIPVGGIIETVPVKESAAFLGWSLELDGEVLGLEYVPVDNCVLYAVWQVADESTGMADTEQETDADYDDGEAVEETESAQQCDDAETAEENEAGSEDTDETGTVKKFGETADEADTAQEIAEDTNVDSEEYTTPETYNERDKAPVQGMVYSDKEETIEESSGSSVVEEDSNLESSEEEETVSEDASMGIVESGTCGDNLTWTLDGEGTLTISGTGKMYDFDDTQTPWGRTGIYTVIIKDGVTNIGINAFYRCEDLLEIIISESVTKINDYAFYGCVRLKKIVIPNTVDTLGISVFMNCTALKTAGPIGGGYNIEFGWCDSIPHFAFIHSSVESIIIPEGITTIGHQAFAGCRSLKYVKIPKSAEFIYNASIFGGCYELTTAGPIGEGYNIEFAWTETIPSKAFQNSSLKRVIIPDGITEIGYQAFEGCDDLEYVRIPGSVVSMHYDGVFSGCKKLITAGPIGGGYNIEFGWTTDVPIYAFYKCEYLKSIDIPNGITSIKSSSFCYCSSLQNISIPDSVTEFGGLLFYYCSSLKSVRIPSSVTSFIGNYNFNGCSSLTSVYFAGNAPEFNQPLFENNSITVYFPADDQTWTESVKQNFGNNIIWVPWNPGTDPTVTPDPDSFSLSIGTPACNAIVLGEDGMLSAVAWYDFNNQDTALEEAKNIKWTCSDSAAVEIYDPVYDLETKDVRISLGLRGKKPGSYTITGTAPDGRTASADVVVEPKIVAVSDMVTITETTDVVMLKATLDIGDKQYLTNFLNNISYEGVFTGTNGEIGYVVNKRVEISDDGKIGKLYCTLNINDGGRYNFAFTSSGGQQVGEIIYADLNSITSNRRLGWSIKNTEQSFGYDENYHFSLQTYGAVYGATPRSMINALVAKTGLGKWDGNCFGMSLLAGSSYLGQIDLSQYFSNEGNYLWEYGYEKKEQYEGREILTVAGNEIVHEIEKAQISQASNQFLSTEIFQNDDNYKYLISYLRNTDNCILIGFEINEGSHAVLFDNNREIVELLDSPGVYYIPIYDPNVPLGRELLNNPHRWYEMDENYILLDTNNGKYTYTFTYKGEIKSERGNHRWLNHRYIQFFNLSALDKDYYYKRLSLAFNPNNPIFGFNSKDIEIQIDGTDVINVKDNEIVQLNSNYDYSVWYDNSSESAMQRYIEIPSESNVTFVGNDVKAVLSNKEGAFSIDSESEIEVVSSANTNQVKVISNQTGIVTLSYSFIDDEQNIITEECEASLNEGESFECKVEDSVKFTSDDRVAASISHFENDNASNEEEVILPKPNTGMEEADASCITSTSISSVANTNGIEIKLDKGSYAVQEGEILTIDAMIKTDKDRIEGQNEYIGYFAYYANRQWNQLASWDIEGGTTKYRIKQKIDNWPKYGDVMFSVSVFPKDSFVQGSALIDNVFLVNVSPHVVDSGSCGGNVIWKITSAGTLTISGTGPIEDFAYSSAAPWYNHTVNSVIIGDGITRIGDYAFYDSAMTNLSLPESLESIGCFAFSGLTGLNTINIPRGVSSIDRGAFAGSSYNANKITSITVDESNSTFSENDGVVYSKDGSVLIAYPAGRLGDFSVPEGVRVIGDSAFSGCKGLTGISIPESAATIENLAFAATGLSEITIPNKVHSIGESAFANCRELKTVFIEGPVKTLKQLTFNVCYTLQTIYLPESIEKIEQNTFFDCRSLKDVYFSGSERTWSSVVIEHGKVYDTYIIDAAVHFAKENETIVLDESCVSIYVNDQIWTGEPLIPIVSVKYLDDELIENVDYTLSYSGNTDVGTATVTITGKGNCTGTITETFKINKAEQSITAKASASSVTVGKTVTVSIFGAKGKKSYTWLKADTDTGAVTVDSSTGKVKGTKVGIVTIKATSKATDNFNAATKKVRIKVVPAATASVKADNLATGIKLTWKKVTGATGYLVYRGSTKIATIKSASTVTYTDKKANTNGTKYTFKIVPMSSYGNGPAKSLTTYRIARPTINSVTSSASKRMTVKWGKNSKASGYQIHYCTDKTFKSGNKSVSIKSAGTVAKVIASLTKGKTYYVRIRTYKTVGSTKYFSAWSPVKSVKISK